MYNDALLITMRNVGSELSQLDTIWSQINRVVRIVGMKGCTENFGAATELILASRSRDLLGA